MNPIEPGWVGILMAVMTAIGVFLPKLQAWMFDKKKQDQSDTAFIIANYKDTVNSQQDKLLKMEGKLVELQQKIVDIQTANVTTIMENMTMKQQILSLTAENTVLRGKVDDLERRMQK